MTLDPISNLSKLAIANIGEWSGMGTVSDIAQLEKNAVEVANILRALANERRLMILCQLVEYGEATVGSLVEEVGISQSALSQHLGKMRDEGIVTFRRESQTIWYRIADKRIEQLFATLHHLFCRKSARTKKTVRRVRRG